MATRSGRPKRDEERKVIYLHKSTLDKWNRLKENVREEGGKLMTNNEFAVFLLNRISTLICQQQQNLPTTTNLLGCSSQLVDHAYEHERKSGDITLPRNSSSATNQRGGAVGKSFILFFSWSSLV